jgi:hypothetical protein
MDIELLRAVVRRCVEVADKRRLAAIYILVAAKIPGPKDKIFEQQVADFLINSVEKSLEG